MKVSMEKINKNLTSFRVHLDEHYGKAGTPTRVEFEKGFDEFKRKAIKPDGKTR